MSVADAVDVAVDTEPDIPDRFRPANDSEKSLCCSTADAGDVEPETAPFAGDHADGVPEELRGVSLDVAENRYIGKRRAEATNADRRGWRGLRARALRTYAQILDRDRRLRATYSDPSLAMLTLVGREHGVVGADIRHPLAGGDRVARVEYAEAVSAGVGPALKALRRALPERSDWVAVRDCTHAGFSHWHLVAWYDGDVDRDRLARSVDSYVRNTAVADGDDHPLAEAVKVDSAPSDTVDGRTSSGSGGTGHESGERAKGFLESDDGERAPAHPLARYVASSLPHLFPVGDDDLSPAGVRHGAVEWATPTAYVRGL